MLPQPFDKYEGLGNDFVVLEQSSFQEADRERARQLCDRHFGVGADGVLFVLPAEGAAAHARMLVINADGSRPEMCGNGLRCVALHLARREPATTRFMIETDGGLKSAELAGTGERREVRADMGRAEHLPELELPHGARRFTFQRISMGNPHAVAFVEAAELRLLDELGPLLNARVEGGVNVELVAIRGPLHFEVAVWERGVGRTLACGTGAAATAAAAIANGRARFDTPLQIQLPGGPLRVTVRAETWQVLLEGPARHVFSGVLTP